MTIFPDLFAALAAPFDPRDVKTRPGGNGRKLSYITARTAANRLDSVLGPENWESEFYEVCGVLFCRLTIMLPDGRKVAKSDAGGFKQMTMKDQGKEVLDEENTDKTGASDSFKRACSMFGIARVLYGDGVANLSPAEPTPARPAKPAGRAGADPFEAILSRALGRWDEFDPMPQPDPGQKSLTERSNRIVQRLITDAIADERVAAGKVCHRNDKGEVVRVTAACWEAARWLVTQDRDWVLNAIKLYLDEKRDAVAAVPMASVS